MQQTSLLPRISSKRGFFLIQNSNRDMNVTLFMFYLWIGAYKINSANMLLTITDILRMAEDNLEAKDVLFSLFAANLLALRIVNKISTESNEVNTQ